MCGRTKVFSVAASGQRSKYGKNKLALIDSTVAMSKESVVVSEGIYGTWTAWEIAKRRKNVTLLEAKTIASGASDGPRKRGVRANDRDSREPPLMETAYDQWTKLAEEIGTETGYEHAGHLILSKPEGGFQGSFDSSSVRQLVQVGLRVPSQRLDAEAVNGTRPGRLSPFTAYCLALGADIDTPQYTH